MVLWKQGSVCIYANGNKFNRIHHKRPHLLSVCVCVCVRKIDIVVGFAFPVCVPVSDAVGNQPCRHLHLPKWSVLWKQGSVCIYANGNKFNRIHHKKPHLFKCVCVCVCVCVWGGGGYFMSTCSEFISIHCFTSPCRTTFVCFRSCLADMI